MKLTKIFEDKYFVENIENAEVRFYVSMYDCEPPIHTTSINLVELYKNWLGECDYCPENDSFIYAVEFNVNGKIYWKDNNGDFTFEDLMEAFERYFPQYYINQSSTVSIKVIGYVEVEVQHGEGESTESIMEKANKLASNINFGELENIDWDAQQIVE